MENVILVDLDDQACGLCEKQAAHEKGVLHRAFSVFLFHGESLLLQKRASTKYHCGSLWTNTCCSHPRADECVIGAAERRLQEELGISGVPLREVTAFVYRYPFSNGLTEFEYDHVLVGEYDGGWIANPEEVDAVQWVPLQELKTDIQVHPEHYTPWFLTALGYAAAGRR